MGRPNFKDDNLGLIVSRHDARRAYLSLIILLVSSVLIAGGFDVQAARAASGQVAIEALHVPELDAGFHLLYELKLE
jgi:hypothetical protein